MLDQTAPATVLADASPRPPAVVLAPAMPREAPLAMPVQSLRRFPRSARRAWVDSARAATPWLARLFVFGGALALTAYGAREMYGVVEVGEITTLEWAMVALFVINFSWICVAFTSSLARFRVARRPRAAKERAADLAC